MNTTRLELIKSLLRDGKSTTEIFETVPDTKRQDIHNMRYRMRGELKTILGNIGAAGKTPKEEEKQGYTSHTHPYPLDLLHDLIQTWGLGFHAGNVVKYVVRHRVKDGINDLKEAKYNLDSLIALIERGGSE